MHTKSASELPSAGPGSPDVRQHSREPSNFGSPSEGYQQHFHSQNPPYGFYGSGSGEVAYPGQKFYNDRTAQAYFNNSPTPGMDGLHPGFGIQPAPYGMYDSPYHSMVAPGYGREGREEISAELDPLELSAQNATRPGTTVGEDVLEGGGQQQNPTISGTPVGGNNA